MDISPEAVKRLLDQSPDGVMLLDCREPDEVQVARIDGATHIPMGDIPTRLASLDPDRPTVVYCHHGIRSRQVAGLLREQGFADVRSLSGGIDAWSRQIDPTVPTY